MGVHCIFLQTLFSEGLQISKLKVKIMKRQVRLQENICKTHIRLMTVIQSIKELLKLNLKKATQLKNGSKT